MPGTWIDMNGPILANTVYSDGVLVAKDVSFSFSGADFKTVTMNAMGDMTVPLLGLFDNMDLTITKIGVDMGLGTMNKLEKQNIEMRFVQTRIQSDSAVGNIGCKAFYRTLPAGLPGLEAEPGSTIEVPVKLNVTRAQLYADGEEVYCVDRLAGILRYYGKDYMTSIDNLL